MIHDILITIECKKVIYPQKIIKVYKDYKCIGYAQIVSKNGKKVAKTELPEPIPLKAMGNFVIRDGDLIDEFKIEALSI